jgi:hypothetical protein
MSTNEAPSPDGGFDAADAKIDALLREFFRAEVPVTLPPAPLEAPDDWEPLTPLEAPRGFKGSKWDFAAPALLASLAVMLVCGLMLLPRPRQNEPQFAGPLPPDVHQQPTPAVWVPDVTGFPRSPTFVEARSERQKVKGGEVDVMVMDGDALVDLKYYKTSLGLVEQRVNVEWTTVRLWDSDSGEWLEATVPSVRVDVVPLGQ